MQILPKTKMMLFRFSNYKNYDFIEEHRKVMTSKGCVWMLKVGRKTQKNKLEEILQAGGYILLRAPIKNEGKCYIAKFTEISETLPSDKSMYPSYYGELLRDYEFDSVNTQLFKIETLEEISADNLQNVYLISNGKNVVEVINQTRTAFMFVENRQIINS